MSFVMQKPPVFPGDPERLRLSPLSLRLRKVVSSWYCSAEWHGFSHVIEFEPVMILLIEKMRAHSITIDADVCLQAWYGHDAGWGVPFQDLAPASGGAAFNSKEEFSAVVTRGWLLRQGAHSEHANRVYQTIMATDFRTPLETVEQKCIRACDLSNLVGPYADFSANWDRLCKEQEDALATTIDPRQWARMATNYLSLFLWCYIELTPEAHDDRGVSLFHQEALGNILRKLRTVLCHSVWIVGKIAKDGRPMPAPPAGTETIVVVSIDTDPTMERMMALMGESKRITNGTSTVPILLPGTVESMPLADGELDDFIVDPSMVSKSALMEIARVCKK